MFISGLTGPCVQYKATRRWVPSLKQDCFDFVFISPGETTASKSTFQRHQCFFRKRKITIYTYFYL